MTVSDTRPSRGIVTSIDSRHASFADSPLVRLASTPDALLRAWEVVRANDEADGDPSPASLRFAASITSEIDRLHLALTDSTYRPSGLLEVVIPKSSGGARLLRIPSIRDRVVERSLLSVLAVRVDPWLSPLSFAYRAGSGVDDAIRRLLVAREEGARFVVRADIADCFDRIDHRVMLDVLLEWTDEGVVELVDSLLRRPSRRFGSRHWSWTGEGTAQGAPLSPLLANLHLDRLDRDLAGRGITAIRYGDDLTIPVVDLVAAEAVLGHVDHAVGAIGMALNPDKTAIESFDEGFHCLGVDIGPTDPPAPVDQHDEPEQRALYVATQGSNVFVSKGQIKVHKGEEELLTVPLSVVGQIVCFGSIGLSAGLRDRALVHDIEVTLCSRSGAYRGRLDGAGKHRVGLRRVQYRVTDDPSTSLPIAKAMVLGKIANQAALLARYSRRTEDDAIVRAIEWLRDARHRVADAPSRNALMGVEGAAARMYFGVWPMLLPGIEFVGRTYRPPKDVVNAALSFGYSILTGNAVAAVASTGLDPSVGLLHADEDGRPSLALDLMEEFRPVVVDAVVIDAVRRRILTAEGGSTSPRGDGVWLAGDARGRFLQRLEERMLTVFAHTPSGRRVSYRRALYLQARQVAAAMQGLRDYEPIRWR